ncbi:hypothetical protein FK529_00005 [Tsukamurella asaccharolytica]|uniref:DUF4162 domain-containing protein n=1 Tax=Tsukamurella asaccharolytica TaxID=2592067 RepID=A0A5C5REG2_9ACTN|nr:hypothetical protein [Tsukamurella asaccharolytica]TWS21048.1 hypothetical protein FK529_00005 [Tsukamurella asaccharolytica]
MRPVSHVVDSQEAPRDIDDPGVPLPSLSGGWSAGADGAGRVTLRTHRLQDDLHALLGWAADRSLALSGLQARHPSLESVFLTIASEDETATDTPIGAPA